MADRAPRPEDLYELRVPTQLDLSPDGRFVAFCVKAVAPGKDGYRSSLWIVPADGSTAARQLTVGAKSDTTPRWSPDGRTLAFLSDRGAVLQAGGGGAKPGKAEAPAEGGTQAWLLPFADGGEARQLTDLPKDVSGITWSPDGRRIAWTTSLKKKRGELQRPPELHVMRADGSHGMRLTNGRHLASYGGDFSPDGRWIVFVAYRDETTSGHLYKSRPDGTTRVRLRPRGAYRPADW